MRASDNAAEAAASDIELRFGEAVALSESAQAALEDYARVVAQAAEAEALRAGGDEAGVVGVRLLAPVAPPGPRLLRDVEDFARALAQGGRNDRLGWS